MGNFPAPPAETGPLTFPAGGDIVPLSNRQRRRRTRTAADREGRARWKRPTTRGGCTTPEPPGTTGPGLSRYRKTQSGQMSRCTPSATANCSTLRRKCRRASPDLFFGLRVSLLSCSRASPRFWQAGWNRGTYDDASPLTHSGVRRFLLCPVVGAKSAPFAAPLRGASHSAPLHLLSEPNPLRWASVRFGWGSQI